MTAADAKATSIELIVRFANGGRLAAKDVALIEAIRIERSILAASKATGVAYRTCWLTVDALNRTFETPVITTFPGRRGGGAQLTAFGERLVTLYKSMERRASAATDQAVAELSAALNPAFEPRASGAAAEESSSQPDPSRSQLS
ncbi:MAG: ModE family transcriptional regulator [Alphaproteobacteria bacterium]